MWRPTVDYTYDNGVIFGLHRFVPTNNVSLHAARKIFIYLLTYLQENFIKSETVHITGGEVTIEY